MFHISMQKNMSTAEKIEENTGNRKRAKDTKKYSNKQLQSISGFRIDRKYL